MPRPQRFLLSLAVFFSTSVLANAQIGVISNPPTANSLLICSATAAGTPELRPEGYTELAGDIVINCTGGQPLQAGVPVPTTNVVVYISPAVPITSRSLAPSAYTGSFASEAMLVIDEAGALLQTGVTGNYGPKAPQSLCTSTTQGGCPAYVSFAPGFDSNYSPVNYAVAVTAPNGTTPAANVYQGQVGIFGYNSVAFFNVPVLPPAYAGVSRTFRITNIRIPIPGENITGVIQALIVTSPNELLPIGYSYYPINIGAVGPAGRNSVTSLISGGGNSCAPRPSPTLAAQLTFTEGFATAFKTRVIPGGATNSLPFNGTGNITWAGEAQNLASPANQNIPGGLYGGFVSYNESGFILPAASFTDPASNITYTAGLADFGTRLKAVFTNIPSGLTLYVSTTSTGSVAVPGGTSTTPYAVLVAASQHGESSADGTAFAPLTSALPGSDGLFAYPLAADSSGVTAAIWEVVDSSPFAQDNLTFSVYLACGTPVSISPPSMSLGYSPESGGGSFSTVTATEELIAPVPRFDLQAPCTTNNCVLSANASPSFSYSIGGPAPASQVVPVTVVPSTLAVAVTPVVTSPEGGTWLSALLDHGNLYVVVNPLGLVANPLNPYTGYVRLFAYNLSEVDVPVSLTVYPQTALSISMSHTGNFVQGEQGATYTIVVSSASVGPTNGLVTVTEHPPIGESIISMTGDPSVWTCGASSCTTSKSIVGGGSYPPITVSVIVASNAASPLANTATVSGGGSAASPSASDLTTIVPLTCNFTGGATPTVADVQMMIDEALGLYPATFDLNKDGSVNIADVEVVAAAAIKDSCVI